MSDNSQTPIWPLITGVATLSLSAILVILKSGILVSILFLLLGSSLVLAWYYFYSKKNFLHGKKVLNVLAKYVVMITLRHVFLINVLVV